MGLYEWKLLDKSKETIQYFINSLIRVILCTDETYGGMGMTHTAPNLENLPVNRVKTVVSCITVTKNKGHREKIFAGQPLAPSKNSLKLRL